MLDAIDAIIFSHLYVVSIIIICIYSVSKKWDTLKLVIFCYLDRVVVIGDCRLTGGGLLR